MDVPSLVFGAGVYMSTQERPAMQENAIGRRHRRDGMRLGTQLQQSQHEQHSRWAVLFAVMSKL